MPASVFRYPNNIVHTIEPWREYLGPEFDRVVEVLQRRDRDLEDYVSRAQIITHNTIQKGALAAQSTASATYVDVTGPIDLSFKKYYDDTRIKVEVHFSGYKDTNTGRGHVGVRINGVDYDVSAFFFNTMAEHNEWSGFAIVPVTAALKKGTVYTARLRIRTDNANFNTDTNDQYAMSITEIY